MVGRRLNLLTLLAGVLLLLASCTGPITTPEPFTFNDVDGAAPGAVVTSNEVTITGINTSAPAKVTTGGTLIIDGEAAGSSATVDAGDKLAVRVTASERFGGEVVVTVDVGGVTAGFTVTTREAESMPDFVFEPVTDAQPGAVITSQPFTVGGLEAVSLATVSGEGSPQLILNGDEDAAGFTQQVENGDQLQVRLTASSEFGATTTAEVDIGGAVGTFVVTTAAPAPSVTLSTDLEDADDAEPGQRVTLSWTVAGEYDEVVLTSSHDDMSEDVTSLSSFEVVLPSNVSETSYTLTATHSGSGFVGTDSTGAIAIPLWVCENDDDLITFPDESLRERFYAIPTTPAAGEPITCADAHGVHVWDTMDHEDDPGDVQSLVGMQHLANLREFKATYNQISDLRPLSGLHNLEQLNLDKNLITDISPLAGLRSLRILELWDNGPVRDEHTDGIESIEALASIPTLEELYLSENNISDLEPLADLTSLRVLFLIATDVEDISPLEGLTTLQVLRLSGNRISDGSALSGLENLAWLELDENFLRDGTLEPFEGFENLFVVRLDGNYFTDFSPLIDNDAFPAAEGAPGLPSHRQQPTAPLITIGWNCLDAAQLAATVTALEAKSDDLTVDQGVGGAQRDQSDCEAFLQDDSLDLFELQREGIRNLRENNRIR